MSKAAPKIAIVANSTWNIYNFRLNVLRELTDKGFDITVIAPIDDYIGYLDEFPHIAHRPLRNLTRKGKNPIEDLQLYLELRQLYREIEPDVVLHYTIKPNIYGSLAHNPLHGKTISIVTGLGYTFIHNGWLNRISKGLHRIALKNNYRVLFENQDDRLMFVQEDIIADRQGISMKGCGVNVEFYAPRSPLPARETTVFTFIGRLLYDKGIVEFVNAARHFKAQGLPFQFVVLGDLDKGNPASIRKEELVSWIKDGIIEYKGFQNDVRSFIDASDCIVLPSYREAIPRALTEAMAMARPVITTDTPGCREAVDEGVNGYLAEVRSTESLIEAIGKFARLTLEERQRMGQMGREKVLREFDERIIARQIVDVISEAVER